MNISRNGTDRAAVRTGVGAGSHPQTQTQAHSHAHAHSHESAAKPSELMRFSVAMPEDLLVDFDQLVARRGLAKNRSEVIRDLVREALADSMVAIPDARVMGTLTIVYDHHSSDLQDKLHAIQHDYCENIISTMHIHVDSHLCLEVIVIRGEAVLVQSIADLISGTKGVRTGKLVLTAIGD